MEKKKKNREFQTDWLASRQVFYNEKTQKISYNINDVIDVKNISFHPEGLYNYLLWGYSVLGQTPVKNVKFLLPNQSICIKNNRLIINNFPDLVDSWENKELDEKYVMELIEKRINLWEKKVKGNIIIPTSGGYDSRLLNMLVKKKDRIRSFTFGHTKKQEDSFEVHYARATTKKLGIKWKQIKIGNFNSYVSEWYKLCGISTHAHGMYQMDFYSKVRSVVSGSHILSGVIGDVWTGNVAIPEVTSWKELSNLGLSHGLNMDPKFLKIKNVTHTLKKQYFKKNKERLRSHEGRLVESMRMKMMLLSYLLRIPENYRYKVYGPFLDPKIVLSILSISPKRRKNRQWQLEYFRKHGLNWEEIYTKPVKFDNTIYSQELSNYPPKPLRADLLKNIIDEKHLEWINKTIKSGPLHKATQFLLTTRYLGYISRKIGIKDNQFKAYNEYLTLKPLEILITSQKNK